LRDAEIFFAKKEAKMIKMKTKYLIPVFLFITLSIFFIACKKNEAAQINKSENIRLLNSTFSLAEKALIPSIVISYNKLLRHQRPTVGDIEKSIRDNYTGDKNILDNSSPSVIVENFSKKFLQDINQGKLISRKEFMDYGIAALQNVENEKDKKQIAFIISHTSVLSDFLMENGQEMKLGLSKNKYPNLPKNNITGEYEIVQAAAIVPVLIIIAKVAAIVTVVHKTFEYIIPGYKDACNDLFICNYVTDIAGIISLVYKWVEIAE
jgi:hypothetical protein